jgi:hypothetical protein
MRKVQEKHKLLEKKSVLSVKKNLLNRLKQRNHERSNEIGT